MSTLTIAPPTAIRVRWDRVTGLLAALIMVVWLFTSGMAGLVQADTVPADPISVVIQPGDTVWDLARTHAPRGMGTLEYAALVEQHNGVRAGVLLPGTVLVLPQG
ncbi:hypothetical protein BH23ACT9_BH23ACT9_31420 [soil metagenome]